MNRPGSRPRFFWETVAQRRSIAFGGNSVREHFNPVDDYGGMLGSREGPETCNSYNMLRLTLLLHRLDPQPRYADFYERVLYNHILSSQHPEHGGLVYFTPIRPRHYRVYSQPGQCFWCCVGSGLENHGRHGAFAYSHGDGVLSVNLYLASRLHWRARGLELEQDTRFPDEAGSRITLHLASPQHLRLRLRHPQWLRGALQVRVNGRPWPLRSQPGRYAELARTWRDGDRIDIALPMHTQLEALPDGSDWVAVMHGPLMLAAATADGELPGLVADDGRGSHIAPGPYLPLDGAPMLVGDRDTLAAGIVPVAGTPLQFSATALIRPGHYRQLRLAPLSRIHDARYMAYWRTTTVADYPAVVAGIEAHERARVALEARTLDQVQPGEQQPEVEHRYAGRDAATGTLLGRAWRDAGGWFEYRLVPPPGRTVQGPLSLQLTLFGGDRGVAMEVQLEGATLAQVALDGSGTDDFVEHAIALPAGSTIPADGLRLRFVAADGRRTPRLFGLRLLSTASP